jgi:type II secretory pathway pseudopilin PulG
MCHNRQAGTSLVEMMIAFVAVVALLGVVLSGALRHSAERRSGAEFELATAASLDNLERIRGLTSAEIQALDGVGFDVPDALGAPGGLRPVPNDPDGLPGQFRVTVDQSLASAVLFRVVATVEWSGAFGRRRLGFEALIGERK